MKLYLLFSFIMYSLTMHSYVLAMNIRPIEDNSMGCAICIDTDSSADFFRLSCHSSHRFHKSCLYSLVSGMRKPLCPLCRHEIEEKDLNAINEGRIFLDNGSIPMLPPMTVNHIDELMEQIFSNPRAIRIVGRIFRLISSIRERLDEVLRNEERPRRFS